MGPKDLDPGTSLIGRSSLAVRWYATGRAYVLGVRLINETSHFTLSNVTCQIGITKVIGEHCELRTIASQVCLGTAKDSQIVPYCLAVLLANNQHRNPPKYAVAAAVMVGTGFTRKYSLSSDQELPAAT